MNTNRLAVGVILGVTIGCCFFGRLGLRGSPAPIEPDAPPSPLVQEAVALAILEGDAQAAALEDWAATRTDTTYGMLQRNAAAHNGERVMFQGVIVDIRDNEAGSSVILLGTSYGGDDIMWVEAGWAEPHLVVGSYARVYGYLAGVHTYTSRGQGQLTVPAMLALVAVPSSLPEHVSSSRRAQLGLAPPP